MDPRSELGVAGEDAVAAWYVARGYRVLRRNWRCSSGEIDLIARRGTVLVVCEVKSRRGSSFGGGFEAVGWRKQRKLRQLADVFLDRSTDVDAAPSVRFDVASVWVGPRGPAVEVFEDAF
jgi:putative endonuclease